MTLNHQAMTGPLDRFCDLKPGALTEEEKASVINLALSVLALKHRRGRALNTPRHTQEYLRLKLADRKHEVFGTLFLDSQHRVIQYAELFQGTIDGAAVYPRVVVQEALALNAAAVVFFHNHPSGVAEPSTADKTITRRLQDALALIDVRVLDHLVVSAGEATSFAERGLL
ncbi:MAG: DNA repair protein RadC [Congregibacter sp.]